MDNREKMLSEAADLVRTPTGQALLRLLQQSGGPELRQTAEKAAAGDMTQLKKLLAVLMENPEAAALLRQLGGNHGPDGR